MAVIVIWYETTAAARWASLFIGRTFFNDTITVAIWTDFHVRFGPIADITVAATRPENSSYRWAPQS